MMVLVLQVPTCRLCKCRQAHAQSYCIRVSYLGKQSSIYTVNSSLKSSDELTVWRVDCRHPIFIYSTEWQHWI